MTAKLNVKERAKKLAEDNIPMAYEVCKKFYNCGIEREEFITLLDMLPWEEKGYEIIENRDFIPAILMNMTKRERECITLTILEERTQEEASRILGLSQSYVSKSIKSGLNKARKAYWCN